MKKQLLHTPDGVRDIYNKECKNKLYLQDKLHKTLLKYGYHDIMTPTFEFFNIFGNEVGTIASKDLYKFFDKEGNTLVLRPDFTPAIARSAAKYYMKKRTKLLFLVNLKMMREHREMLSLTMNHVKNVRLNSIWVLYLLK